MLLIYMLLIFCVLSQSGGGVKFEQKALNCENSGGKAAVIFNNDKGLINGGLAEPTSVTIPVLEITMSAGRKFKAQSLGDTLVVKQQGGYGYLSGTSMAAP